MLCSWMKNLSPRSIMVSKLKSHSRISLSSTPSEAKSSWCTVSPPSPPLDAGRCAAAAGRGAAGGDEDDVSPGEADFVDDDDDVPSATVSLATSPPIAAGCGVERRAESDPLPDDGGAESGRSEFDAKSDAYCAYCE